MPAVTVIRNSLHHNNIPSSPSSSSLINMKEEAAAAAVNLPGIVTILGSDHTNLKTPVSLRRTLSADMSSKKWLQQNGFFSSMKKISSSEVLNQSSEEEDEMRPGQDEVWQKIQAQKQGKDDETVWGSILQSRKTDGSDLLPPPYVHPLVKRSASSLSEKSLEICTESLGSETGSDGFSSYPDSESSGDADDQEGLSLKGSSPFEDLHVVKYKESPARPFPPPLNSIAGAFGDGGSVHMQSRRENGRLVLEAVSVPPRNLFQAERRDGRLVLSLINSPVSEKMNEVFGDVEDEEVDDGGGDEEEEEAVVVVEEKIEKIEKDLELEMEEKFNEMKKSGVWMKKFIALRNKNPTWNTKFNNKMKDAAAVVEEEEVMAAEKLPVIQSLPPRPPAARLPVTTSFNPYEYFWRNKTAAAAGGYTPQPPPLKLNRNTVIKTYENDHHHHHHHQDLVLMRGNKTENLVQDLRGCKEAKRSLLIWEPYCIATS